MEEKYLAYQWRHWTTDNSCACQSEPTLLFVITLIASFYTFFIFSKNPKLKAKEINVIKKSSLQMSDDWVLTIPLFFYINWYGIGHLQRGYKIFEVPKFLCCCIWIEPRLVYVLLNTYAINFSLKNFQKTTFSRSTFISLKTPFFW